MILLNHCTTTASPGRYGPSIQEKWGGTLTTNSKDSTLGAVSAQQIMDLLEEDIVLGILHPRERLVEDDLMDRFAAKRHVVREAIALLVANGLAVKIRNVGALVKSYTRREVVELYGVRELLETSCVASIGFPVPDAALMELTDIQQRHDDAVAQSNLRTAFRMNMAFHRLVFGLGSNQTLVDAVASYAQKTHAVRSVTLTAPAALETARREHWEIIGALQAGDPVRLAALCRQHLLPSLEAFLRTAPPSQ